MDPARGRICFLKISREKKREDEKNSWHQDTFILEFIGLASGKKSWKKALQATDDDGDCFRQGFKSDYIW